MSRQMPYVPMGPRPKIADEAEIQAMLAKIRQPRVTAEVAPALPAKTAPAPILEWEKPVRNEDGTGYVKTTDHRYTCCKVRVQGRMTYELWSILPSWQFQMAAGLESFEQARALAEEHAQKDPTRAPAPWEAA